MDVVKCPECLWINCCGGEWASECVRLPDNRFFVISCKHGVSKEESLKRLQYVLDIHMMLKRWKKRGG